MCYNDTMNIIEHKLLLDKISALFPCVDMRNTESSYFIKNSDHEFHEKLCSLCSSSDFDFLNAFYTFKRFSKSGNEVKVFQYILPPENDFIAITNIREKSIATNKGLYYFFNKEWTENEFEKSLSSVLSVQSFSSNGTLFPLVEQFHKGSENWICSYDNNHSRFTWDQHIDWKNYGYSPNNPWDAFEHYCQYHYSLLRIGYEEDTSENFKLTKTDNVKKGWQKIYDTYEVEKKQKQLSDRLVAEKNTEKTSVYNECLLGNINFGIERTKSKGKLGRYHIKDFKETELEINSAMKHIKYQKDHVTELVDSWLRFNNYDIALIKKLSEKYSWFASQKLNTLEKERLLTWDTYNKILPEIQTFLISEIKKPNLPDKLRNKYKSDMKKINRLTTKVNTFGGYSLNDDSEKGKLQTQKIEAKIAMQDESENSSENTTAREVINKLLTFFAAQFSDDERAFAEYIKCLTSKSIQYLQNELIMIENEDLNSVLLGKYIELFAICEEGISSCATELKLRLDKAHEEYAGV